MKKLTIALLLLTGALTACRENSNPRSTNDNTEVTSQSDAPNDNVNLPDTTTGYDTSGYYDNN